MAVSAVSGPLLVWGQNPTASKLYTPSNNPDLGPSLAVMGVGLLDPRFGYRGTSIAAGEPVAYGFFGGTDPLVIDQVPSAIATANIAALANVTSGTKMTLVSSTGAGITVMATALTIPQTGKVVPAGSLAIDLLPAVIAYGQNTSVNVADPRKAIARAVSITGSTSGTGGAFLVAGYDLYGNPQTETVTATSGATTANGAKGWKFIASVTPQFTDAHNYSVGTTDIYEFPIRADEFFAVDVVWNNGVITANTGFVAADATSPATATTGSVRGTYATQSASDGTKKLQISVSVSPWNANTTTGLFGVTPA